MDERFVIFFMNGLFIIIFIIINYEIKETMPAYALIFSVCRQPCC